MDADVVTVPAPVAPGDPDGWYAQTVLDQYEITPGVVATVTDDGDGFAYAVREPALSAETAAELAAIREHFADAALRRPRTREGTAERFAAGFEPKYRRIVDRLSTASAAGRRRLDYHALAELRCLGGLTPYALDDRIEIADDTGDRLVVHLTDFAPAATDLSDPTFVDRFSAERLERYTVEFAGYEIPVVRYREQLLGTDPFERKYAVLEPDLLPGDERLLAECRARIWEGGIEGLDEQTTVADRVDVVSERAERLLSKRLRARTPRTWLEAIRHDVRSRLASLDLVVAPVDRRFTDDRLEDLRYYLLRDLVGHGPVTIPIRDPNLEDVEANRVGERIKVVPRGSGREPTNLVFADEQTFRNVVTQLAASDGVELSASRPSAKVNLSIEGLEQTMRCAVALPTISEDGPHLSIRKQAADVLTPVDLLESGSLPAELVTLLWMLYEHAGVVLFSGPTGAGKTTLMNAHMPFVAYDARPVSIDEGSREVFLPHETGVSLSTRTHRDEFKNVSMAELMAKANYLNPDVEVIAEINSAASFDTFGEVLQTGHGVLGTTHAETVDTLLNRVIEKGLAPYLLFEVDLVVFPRHVDGERYVDSAIELLSEHEAERLDRQTQTIEKDGTTIHYHRIVERTPDGEWTFAYRHPSFGDPAVSRELRVFESIADRTNRSLDAVEAEFHRKHGYVEYLQRAGVSDVDELFGLLSDLRTNEAATIERMQRHPDRTDA